MTTNGDRVQCRKSLVVSPEYAVVAGSEPTKSSSSTGQKKTKKTETTTSTMNLKRVKRSIVVTDGPVYETGFAFFVVPPPGRNQKTENQKTENPIHVLQLDDGTGTAPKGYYVYHLSQLVDSMEEEATKNKEGEGNGSGEIPSDDNFFTSTARRLFQGNGQKCYFIADFECKCGVPQKDGGIGDFHNAYVTQNLPGEISIVEAEIQEARSIYLKHDTANHFLAKPNYVIKQEAEETKIEKHHFENVTDQVEGILGGGGFEGALGGG